VIMRSLSHESLRVHSPRLAANSSYRRKPVSRKPDWIPCQARNDGLGEKGIPRCLRRGRSFVLTPYHVVIRDVPEIMIYL
jgi:hypothetical protein